MQKTKQYDLGLKDLVTFRPDTSDEHVIRAILIDRTEYHLVPNLKPKIIFDIGGNIGATALMLANAYPEATVYTFEPEPENFKILSINVQAYENIVPFNIALGSKTEKRMLMDSDDKNNLGGFSFHAGGSNAESSKSVEVVDIRDFMKSVCVEKIDLMKIDTEGCEYEILNAIKDNLPPFIMGEAHGVDDFKMFDMLDRDYHLGINKPFARRNYEFYAQRRDANAAGT